jgi:hypothetical protein
MALIRILRCGVTGSLGFSLICLACLFAGDAAYSTDSPDETFLNGLQGNWMMVGTLGGKSVRYRADGERVLQGGFLKLHMIDIDSPPQYEADAFLGFDPKAGDYIAHWLDRFGAAGARVVGQGKRNGEQLVISFPYADGAFRDTFTWRPATKSWSLLIESQASNGTWSTFASYTLVRPASQ